MGANGMSLVRTPIGVCAKSHGGGIRVSGSKFQVPSFRFRISGFVRGSRALIQIPHFRFEIPTTEFGTLNFKFQIWNESVKSQPSQIPNPKSVSQHRLEVLPLDAEFVHQFDEAWVAAKIVQVRILLE